MKRARNPRARRVTPRPEEDRRGVRLERCDRCWRGCRRSDSVQCPLSYEETKFGLKSAVEAGTRTCSQAWITPHTVLGRMWEMKEEEWTRHMEMCEHQGELLPTNIDDLFLWAKLLRAVEVRIAIGVDPDKAPRMKTALKVYELDAFYKHMRETLPPESEWVRPDMKELYREHMEQYYVTDLEDEGPPLPPPPDDDDDEVPF